MNRPKRLFWRLYPSYLLVTIFALVALSIYSAVSFKTFFLDRTAKDLQARAQLLVDSMLPHMTPIDRASIDSICKAAGKRSSARITVILPSGEVVGDSHESPERMDNHSQRPEIQWAFEGKIGVYSRFSNTLKRKMMYVAVPVEKTSGVSAVVRAALPVDSIDRQLGIFQTRKIAVGILVAILAAVVSYFISRRISRPIENLRRGAEEFAKGNLTHRLPTPKSKEMVMLAGAMQHMASDLNERIQTTERQRNELDAVLSSMREGVIALDMDERVLNVNQAILDMFHRTRADSLGRAIQEVIRNPDLHQFVRMALKSEDAAEGEITLYQGKEQILSAHSSPLCDADGKRIGTLIVLHDITRLRRLENMRRDFAANVSHEIKTPLTAIKGFVETLLSGAKDNPDEAARFLEIINTHADRLTAIIEDLMKLSEIEQQGNKQGIPLEKGEIRKVIDAAACVCSVAAEEKKITVAVECAEDLSAEINAHFLEQALVNLIDNAVKYSDEGGSVSVIAEPVENDVVIHVRDQGMGIPGGHLPRLFERFYRVDKSRSRKQGGTGLGLAIVKHIVQAHGGRVEVESKLGAGSCFSIYLRRAGG